MKHLVDIDDELLQDAKRCLNTETIKDTVDQALRIAAERRARQQREALQKLGEIFEKLPPFDRSEMW